MLRVKDWKKFQHYKDRRPGWIKLHRSYMDDHDFQKLPVASRALAPMLWLLASESMDGTLTPDVSELAWKFRQSVSEVSEGLAALIDAGFFIKEQSDSDSLAGGKRDASPEKRREEEEKRREGASNPLVKDSDHSGIVSQIGHLYPGNAHLKSQLLPQRHEHVILEAIQADGVDLVLRGTKAYADAIKRGYRCVYSAERFFGPEKHYLKGEQDWHVVEGPKVTAVVDVIPVNPADIIRRQIEELQKSG